jgi:hypothetical protein
LVVDPAVQCLLGQSAAGVRADRGSRVGLGKPALEADDAAVGGKVDPRFPRIPRHESANGPSEGCNVVALNQCVERIVTSADQLDKGAEGIVCLELDGRAGVGGGKGVGAKEGVRARERDVAGQRLLECDDRQRARKQPRGGGGRSDGNRPYTGGEF